MVDATSRSSAWLPCGGRGAHCSARRRGRSRSRGGADRDRPRSRARSATMPRLRQPPHPRPLRDDRDDRSTRPGSTRTSSRRLGHRLPHHRASSTRCSRRSRRSRSTRRTDWGNLMLIDGAMMLTTRDNFLYHEMMSHPALFTHADPKHVVIIGGGDCGTLREVLKHPGVRVARCSATSTSRSRAWPRSTSRSCASPTTTRARS